MPNSRLTTAAAAVAATLGLAGCSPSSDAASTPATDKSTLAVPTTAAASNNQGILISPQTERQPSSGPADWFTGSVQITPLYNPNDESSGGAGQVTFQPGARTAWHTHPAGQRLVITAGRGWVQEWGGQRREVSAGDVVWFPAGIKHWHGATSTEAMTHIAVQDTVDGSAVSWQEHVTDSQYEGR